MNDLWEKLTIFNKSAILIILECVILEDLYKKFDEIEARNKSVSIKTPKFMCHGSDREFVGDIPAFPKETQNEIDAFNALNKEKIANGETPYSMEDLKKTPRVFAVPAADDNGNPMQMNYAYAIKKTAHAIGKFGDSPVILASQDRYDNFVNEGKAGRIYILEGKSFTPEVTPQGEIFEWVSKEPAKIAKDDNGNDRIVHVTPDMAMEQGVQILIMKDDNVIDDLRNSASMDNWFYKMQEDKGVADLLDKMIKEGRIEHKNVTDNKNPITIEKANDFLNLATSLNSDKPKIDIGLTLSQKTTTK